MIRALSISLGVWLACAFVVGAEPSLDPVVADVRHQVPLTSKELRIPINGPLDTANVGLVLVGIKAGDRAVPIDGWRYCLNAPDTTMPFQTLNVTWPDSVTSGDVDLSFVVWDDEGRGGGTCDALSPATPPACTSATCAVEVIQIAIGVTEPMLHVTGTLTRTLAFDETGVPEPLTVPVVPLPWVGEGAGKAMRVRIVEETHDTTPGAPRFDMCLTRRDGVPSGLTVKPLDGTVPVGTTVLKAHLWMGAEAPSADCASADTAPVTAYDPAACGADGTAASTACQQVSLTLVRTQATFQPPQEATLIRHVAAPFLDLIRPTRAVEKARWQTELGLANPGHAIELDGPLRADLTDATGARTDGSVRLVSQGGNVLTGGQTRTFKVVLDPPDGYGSFDASINLSGVSGTMASAVLPIKVLISMPWWVIPLVIGIGTLLGHNIRGVMENRVPLLEARKKAREVVDMLAAQASQTPDTELQRDLLARATALRNGLHDTQIKADALQTLVTTTEAEVKTVLERHAQTLTTLRAQLKDWGAALDVDADLPMPVSGTLQGMADGLSTVKENLDAENATGAGAALAAATGPAQDAARQFRDWLENEIEPLPDLILQLGAYVDMDDAQIGVVAALEAVQTLTPTDPAGFGAMLGHARPLVRAQGKVRQGVIALLNDLGNVLDTPTLDGFPTELQTFYDELDTAQSSGLNHAEIKPALAALTRVLPAMVNATANWQVLNAGEMPGDAVGADTGAVLSRFKKMMVTQRDTAPEAADDLKQVNLAAITVKTPSRKGYYLLRPQVIQFGESSDWAVMAEEGFEAPSTVEWRVNGQLGTATGVRHTVHHGQQDVLEVAATLTFAGSEEDVTLHTRVLPTGLRGWEDVSEIDKRLTRARRLRTVVTGLAVVVIGTYTLNSGGANMASVVTAFLLGFGADLTVNSIRDLSDKITAT